MKAIFTILILSCMMGTIFGYSLYENYELFLGNRISYLDARSAAMGGTGTAAGGNILDLAVNPANITSLDNGLNAQFLLNVTQLEENRSMPMFNFFDSYVADATYASNTNVFSDIAFAVAYKKALGNLSLSAAFDYRPVVVFDASYEEEVRNNEGSDFDNYPPVLAKNFLDTEGKIDSYGFSLGFGFQTDNDLFRSFNLGFSVNLLRGDYDYERRIIWSEYAKDVSILDDYEENWGIDYEATSFTFGLNTEINQRLSAGFMISPGFEMKTEFKDSDLKGDYDYPMIIRGGIQYRPRNILRTFFNFDFEYVQWSDVSVHYEDAVNYYVGIEHIFPNTVPFRLGFQYVTSPYLKDSGDDYTIPGPIANPAITAGTGFPIYGNLTLDLAGEFMHRKYDTMDLFPDGYYDRQGLWSGSYRPTDRTEADTVREYYVQLKSSLSLKW